MGTGDSKTPFTVADSPSGGGVKSVVSAPLDGLVGPEEFWEIHARRARAGAGAAPEDREKGISVVSHTETDKEDGCFEVVNVLQGGPVGPAEVSFLARHRFDEERKEWSTQTFHAEFEDHALLHTTTVKELSSPFRIEAWMDVRPQRIAGFAEALILHCLITMVVERLGVKESVPGIKDSAEGSDRKPVMVTEAINSSIDPEHFWLEVVDLLKGAIKPGITDHAVREIDGTNWVTVDTFPSGYVEVERFTYDPAKDLLVSQKYENDESMAEASLTETFTWHGLRDPLRLELHKDVAPGRKTPLQFLCLIQSAVDGCIAQAKSSGAWFG
mmetsp:Transcript_103568/g.322722  ORF Transcript_103568/g.322722 Transcript_103568/m.322722 type:complete len:328 (+) Transcript_103568:82-1065(+)